MFKPSISLPQQETLKQVARETLLATGFIFIFLRLAELVRPNIVTIVLNLNSLVWVMLGSAIIMYLLSDWGSFRDHLTKLAHPVQLYFVLSVFAFSIVFYLAPSLSKIVKTAAGFPVAFIIFLLLVWRESINSYVKTH